MTATARSTSVSQPEPVEGGWTEARQGLLEQQCVRIATDQADSEAPAVALADQRRTRRQREPVGDRPRQPSGMIARGQIQRVQLRPARVSAEGAIRGDVIAGCDLANPIASWMSVSPASSASCASSSTALSLRSTFL